MARISLASIGVLVSLGGLAPACSSAAREDEVPTPTGYATASTTPSTGGTAATTGGMDPGSTTGAADGTAGTTAAEDTDEIKLDVLPPREDVPPPNTEGCDALTATIRDFSHNHPDFETFTGTMAYAGLVLPTLGGDGTPQLNPAYAGAQMITSAMTFADWYHDFVGTNHTFEIELALVDEGTGEMVFDSAAFFPIDGFGFGNEGYSNNFHFTTEVHTRFTYGGGEVFSFRGDDDIWVFVDGQLALDLGGLHPPLEASIDMDALGLSLGQTYDMDIFHAERHTDQSNFRIVTTITCFEPPA